MKKEGRKEWERKREENKGEKGYQRREEREILSAKTKIGTKYKTRWHRNKQARDSQSNDQGIIKVMK